MLWYLTNTSSFSAYSAKRLIFSVKDFIAPVVSLGTNTNKGRDGCTTSNGGISMVSCSVVWQLVKLIDNRISNVNNIFGSLCFI